MAITHLKVSTKPDPVDTSLIRPSDWNDDHVGNGLNIDNVLDYGAVGNGVANDTDEIHAALSNAGSGITVLPPGSYLVSGLTTESYSKIDGMGSNLLAASNGITMLTLDRTGHLLQSPDYQLVRDLRVNANGMTTVNGIATTGGAGSSLAAGILENCLAVNVDGYSFDFDNAQFFRTVNCRAIGAGGATGVGMRIANAATDGGGNSHDHYAFHASGLGVGVFVNGTRYIQLHSLNFYNPAILDSSVCGMAFFDADATLYGGAPEYNADGAASVVVDGQTVKRSSMYLNDSHVRVYGMTVAEATTETVFLLENNSTLVLADCRGYGHQRGYLVQADATSTVTLKGTHAAQGIVQNVSGWPDAWVVPDATGQSIMYGSPVHSVDPTLPVLYAHQAPALTGSGTTPPALSYVEDVDLGYCRQAVFTANAGSHTANSALAPTITGTAGNEHAWSMLLKATADTHIGFNQLISGTPNLLNTAGGLHIKAGKVTRLVFGSSGMAGDFALHIFPVGTDAPTIKFSNMQLYQGTAGAATTTADIAKIVKVGAFNPGPVRATTTQLEQDTDAVNVNGKYPGKQVWNSTTNRIVFAVGVNATDVWKDGVNATVHTPV